MRTLALPFMIVVISCAPSQIASFNVPADFVIQYAEGGGFTGRWTGAVIRSDGSVRSWSPSSPDSASALIGTLPRSVVDDLWRSVEESKLMERAGGQEPGNMTRTISLGVHGKQTTASWPYGPSVTDSIKPYAAFYEECRHAVSGLKR